MQIVYRARNMADARTASSLLADVGIDSHIADPSDTAGHRLDTDVIPVLVDNRTYDKARRALRDWAGGQDHDHHDHRTERSIT